jgi:DNA-binding CsgD family transcriptional regulator
MSSLTDSELRVAELAADGRTNREISRTLFITVSTVEQHLTKVYRKLHIASRTALSGHLAELNVASSAVS